MRLAFVALCSLHRHAASISERELRGVQRWDSKAMVIENGVYLGWPAALTFRGPFVMSGVRRGLCCLQRALHLKSSSKHVLA